MSMRDRIRDQLYGSAEDEARRENAAGAFASLTDPLDQPRSARKTLFIALGVEALLAGLACLAPGYVSGLLNDGEALYFAILVPFLTGFAIAFSLYRMYHQAFHPGGKHVRVRDGVMSGFSGYDERSSEWTVWFLATGGGVLNLVALYVLTVVAS